MSNRLPFYMLMVISPILIFFSCTSAASQASRSLSRAAFARQLRLLRMYDDELDEPLRIRSARRASTVADVIARLGPPDDIIYGSEPDNVLTLRRLAIEEDDRVLRYGTDGHGTLATLGEVTVDARGLVKALNGASGVPPPSTLITEVHLRELLRMIHQVDDPQLMFSKERWNPRPVIRAVNTLHALGKRRALAVLGEYARVTAGSTVHLPYISLCDNIAFVILTILFKRETDSELYGYGHIISVHGDIPFLLPVPLGYLSGKRGDLSVELPTYRKIGRLRATPLHPTDAPLKALTDLERSPEWLRLKDFSIGERRRLGRVQLLRLLDGVYSPGKDTELNRSLESDELERRWKTISAEIARRRITWNYRNSRYVLVTEKRKK